VVLEETARPSGRQLALAVQHHWWAAPQFKRKTPSQKNNEFKKYL